MNKVYIGDLTDGQETAVMDFMNDLPHGSGIDCDWVCTTKGDYVLFSNSYHCMNEWGMYDGYQDFTVKLNKHDFMRYIVNMGKLSVYPQSGYTDKIKSWAVVLLQLLADDMILEFNGGNYLARKYDLRSYLDETIYYSIFMASKLLQGDK